MKKILLSLLCLFIISCGISCVCASSDLANATQNQDFLQNDTQNVTVDNTTIVIDQNATASAIENITADDNGTVQSNETLNNVTGNSTYKLDIKGPNLNGTDLKIKGPNVSSLVFKGPSDQFFITNYAKLFMSHPDWEIDEIVKAVAMHRPWNKVPMFVSKAYALALQVKGDEMLYKDGITQEEVGILMTKHPDRVYPDYEDYPF